MRDILLIIMFVTCCCGNMFAQKIEWESVQNNIYLVRAGAFEFSNRDKFELCVDLFSDGNKSELFVVARSEKNKYYNFPGKGKLLFKLFDGTVMDLTLCYSVIDRKSQYAVQPMGWFPISFDDFKKIKNIGVAKIRLEMLDVDEKNGIVVPVFIDKEYKTDKLGEMFKKMSDLIDKKIDEMVAKSKKSQRKNANDGF